MTRSQEILEFVRNGRIPDKRIVSATFGHDWIAQAFGKPLVSVSDYLDAMRRTEVDNIVCLGTDYGKHNPKLSWKEFQREKNEDGYIAAEEINTPHGALVRKREMKPGFDPWTVESAVRTSEDFAKVEWYAQELANCVPLLVPGWEKELEIVGGEAVSGIMLLLPVEMYWLVSYADQCLMYMDYPEQCKRAMDAILESNKVIAAAALKAGVQLIVMGSAGLELFSPDIFRNAIIPYAKEMCSFVRENGGLSFYHMCGHSLEIARLGWLNEIHPDIFETFSPPPCGVVKNLAEARAMLSPEICSRGNLPVEILLDGPSEKIIKETKKLASMTKDWKHIIGIADTVMGGTPPENIRTFARTARGEF
jgi:hypothetical protein